MTRRVDWWEPRAALIPPFPPPRAHQAQPREVAGEIESAVAADHVPILLDMARLGQERDFKDLAGCLGVPLEDLDAMWQGTVARLRRDAPQAPAEVSGERPTRLAAVIQTSPSIDRWTTPLGLSELEIRIRIRREIRMRMAETLISALRGSDA